MATTPWQNISAGPRQIKPLQKALGALRAEGQTYVEITGVVGGVEHRTALYIPFGGSRPEVQELDEAIRAKYDYKITRENVRAITEAYETALPEARESRPETDKRRTPDEDAAIKATAATHDAEYQAARVVQAALLAQVTAKAPRGTQALIVAEYHEDASDPQSDYFNSRTVRTVAIGFRTGAREDFRQLRAAAARFPETADVKFTEHRDNHSMGAGNYLYDHNDAHSGTGWVIRSRSLTSNYLDLTEDAIPDAPAAPTASAVPVVLTGAVTVTPSSLGREGVVEIRFADKPSEDVRSDLKAHGFRWARGNACWYGTDTVFADALAAGQSA